MAPTQERATKLTVLSNVQSAPKISIKGRWKDPKVRNNAPGPGSYTPQPEKVKTESHGVTMCGRNLRMPRELAPGPGQYYQGGDSLGASTGRYSFPRTQRLKGRMHQPSPGPGSYKVGPLNKGTSATFSEKFESGAFGGRLSGPGPGHYTAAVADPLQYAGGPRFGFGTSTRQTGTVKSGIILPGPGHYVKNVSFTSSAPKYSMKSRPQTKSDTFTPGPGSSVALVSSFG
ncbi:unnamed protein product [Amoebophrya sp. A25]|nr:unnamed protein product [Amoebophrya sp. A25]|eukprot:GSA25T00015449001.1